VNTIPLTFNEKESKRTILGGTEALQNVQLPVSAVLLNNGTNQYRDSVLENLLDNGFESIISIETASDNYRIEDLSRRFPEVKFIVLHEALSVGEMINAAVAETESEYVFVLRDTLKISAALITPRFFDHPAANSVFCMVPRLLSPILRPLPVRFSPSIAKKRFSVDIALPVTEGQPTLFPFDFIGLYNRKKFIQLGGFDHTITSPYWQNLDFSLRAWLWGESIAYSPRLQIVYDTDPDESDTSPNASYLRFYLKNIAPVLKTDYAYIPGSTFFSYKIRCRSGWFDAKRQFDEGRRWIEANKFRFTHDITSLCNAWGQEQ
jgi:GT2 family glycosyltransferase